MDLFSIRHNLASKVVMKFSCETCRATCYLTDGTSSGFLSDRIARTSELKEWEPDCNYRNIKKKKKKNRRILFFFIYTN